MALLDWSQCPAVERVPGKVSGAWVLRGTRMSVATIFENLEAGASLDDLLAWYTAQAVFSQVLQNQSNGGSEASIPTRGPSAS